jgi:hypothetical protein
MYLAQDSVQCRAVFISAVLQTGRENLWITLNYLTHPQLPDTPYESKNK